MHCLNNIESVAHVKHVFEDCHGTLLFLGLPLIALFVLLQDQKVDWSAYQRVLPKISCDIVIMIWYSSWPMYEMCMHSSHLQKTRPQSITLVMWDSVSIIWKTYAPKNAQYRFGRLVRTPHLHDKIPDTSPIVMHMVQARRSFSLSYVSFAYQKCSDANHKNKLWSNNDEIYPKSFWIL